MVYTIYYPFMVIWGMVYYRFTHVHHETICISTLVRWLLISDPQIHSRHRSRPESPSVNGEHVGSVDVCGIMWAPKFTIPEFGKKKQIEPVSTYPL